MQIAVRQHPLFERDGRHLYCEIPISFADAALGGELEVPTLDGRVKLKIPSETQTGKMFRLRGKGVKPVRVVMAMMMMVNDCGGGDDGDGDGDDGDDDGDDGDADDDDR